MFSKEDLHMGLSAIALILIGVVLLIELGILDIELEPQEEYFNTVNKWIGA